MADGTRALLVDVARHADVSVASVSRVLNGLPSTPEMARRVHEAVAATGYQPDARGRSLKRGRSDQLSVLVADIGNPVYVSMVRGVEKTTAAAGQRLLLSSSGGDPDAELAHVLALGQGFADGLIISPLRLTPRLIDALRVMEQPVVVIGGLPRGTRLDNVRADSPKGVQLVVEHMAERGRRRVAFLNGPPDTVPGAARAQGFAAAVERYDVTTSPMWQTTAADFTYEAGIVAATALAETDGFDAVVCANDLLAVAMCAALRAVGRSVPGDVAVAGMDDTDIAAYVNPSLTSVDLGSFERGSIAAELLLARLADPGRRPMRRTVPPQLRPRASTGAA